MIHFAQNSLENAHSTNAFQSTNLYEALFFKTLLVLFIIIFVIAAVMIFYRRFSNNRFRSLNVQKHIKVIENRPISPKTMLYLIEIAGKKVLLAESQMEVRRIQEIDFEPPSSS